MPRPFIMPDPGDRSQNDPAVLVESKKVLGLYNQQDGAEKKSYVTDTVKNWYSDKAKAEGWDTVRFVGNQALLEKDFGNP